MQVSFITVGQCYIVVVFVLSLLWGVSAFILLWASVERGLVVVVVGWSRCLRFGFDCGFGEGCELLPGFGERLLALREKKRRGVPGTSGGSFLKAPLC
jgi:hypothetical protein